MSAAPPPLVGLVETALYVSDLARARTFYQNLFHFEQIFEEEGRLIALAVRPNQVLLLFREGATTAGSDLIPGHDSTGPAHLAFGIEPETLDAWRHHLAQHRVPIESDIPCGGEGRSLYFRDPDGHLLELVTRGCWKVF